MSARKLVQCLFLLLLLLYRQKHQSDSDETLSQNNSSVEMFDNRLYWQSKNLGKINRLDVWRFRGSGFDKTEETLVIRVDNFRSRRCESTWCPRVISNCSSVCLSTNTFQTLRALDWITFRMKWALNRCGFQLRCSILLTCKQLADV